MIATKRYGHKSASTGAGTDRRKGGDASSSAGAPGRRLPSRMMRLREIAASSGFAGPADLRQIVELDVGTHHEPQRDGDGLLDVLIAGSPSP